MTRRFARRVGLMSAVGVVGQVAPTLAIRRPLRARLPALAGRGKPGCVLLSFDDGPDPTTTPHVLAGLRDLGWSAIFFMLAERVHAHPEVARSVIAGGHAVGLHGLSHRRLLHMSPGRTFRELAEGTDTITHVVGMRPRWYRPAYGELTGAALGSCAALRLRPLLWTAESGDWRAGADPESMRQSILRTIEGGGTVLCHDAPQPRASGGISDLLEAFSMLSQDFAKRGLEVVDVAEMFDRRSP